MGLSFAKNAVAIAQPTVETQSDAPQSRLYTWRLSWEILLFLLATGFLCLYRINTTEFNTDQALLFAMAHDAVHYGLLPVTSNAASVGLSNPPAAVYLLLLPALLSANPLWAAVEQGLFTMLAVLLTYLFTRRYYGRLAAIAATLLYAISPSTIHFGRFIWQPNMMSPFLLLFLLALFRGVVERRKGWFAPAIVLLGLLFQLHQSTALLLVPLLLAIVLAAKTIRGRDIALAGLLLLLIYLPYVYWEIHVHFVDIHALLSLSKQQAVIDGQALHDYKVFFIPFGQQPDIANSAINDSSPYIAWLQYVMPFLVFCGAAVALLLVLRPQGQLTEAQKAVTTPSIQESIRVWWEKFRVTPSSAGLLLLLIWQVVPLLLLTRHTVDMQLHYLVFLMPGPFILIGLLLAQSVAALRHYRPHWRLPRYSIYLLLSVIVIGQLIGSVAAVIDITSGNFNDRAFYIHYRNDLNSLQHALSETDQLAQRRHLKRVYITTDPSSAQALRYLSEQTMHTPTTLFDATNCLVLPDPSKGSVALLMGPYDNVANALVGQFATATLVEQPARPGGAPFRLYVVTPSIVQSTSATGLFDNTLQLLQAQTVTVRNSPWLVTRWSMLRSTASAPRTNYNYTLTMHPAGGAAQSQGCSFTALQAGDQLLVAFALPPNRVLSRSVTLGAQSSTTLPYNPSLGLLHFETYRENETPLLTLHTSAGKTTITVPIS
ncbi:MAG: ArnT family glycosyltransferase [Ktedonobacteraceae bacterium]